METKEFRRTHIFCQLFFSLFCMWQLKSHKVTLKCFSKVTSKGIERVMPIDMTGYLSLFSVLWEKIQTG